MRTVALSALAVGLLAFACATPPSPTTSPNASPSPSQSPSQSAESPAVAPTGAPDDTTTTVPTAVALTAEQQEILETINDPYAKETNPKAWSRRFEKEGREVHDRQAEVLAELAIAPGSSVADVGAGTGLYTIPFAEAVGPTGHVFAVDVQPYFLDHVRQRATKAGLDQVTTVQANERSSELPEAAVDVVFMCDAYHHIEQPQSYLASLHSALKPGGRLVIIDYERGEAGTWRYDHIRAAPAVFRAEIEAAGFVLERQVELLEENFFYVFRRA